MRTITTKLFTISACIIVAATSVYAEPAGNSQKRNDDPIAKHLVAPDFVMDHADQLGLNPAQRMAIKTVAQETHAAFEEKQKTLMEAVKSMDAKLGSGKSDDKEILAQLDKVLDAERAIKHLHIGMFLKVRRQLNAEQYAAARKMIAHQRGKAFGNQNELEKRIKGKLARVKGSVDKLVESGEQPFEIAELMSGFSPLMEAGQVDEAEALLDKALKLLAEKNNADK